MHSIEVKAEFNQSPVTLDPFDPIDAPNAADAFKLAANIVRKRLAREQIDIDFISVKVFNQEVLGRRMAILNRNRPQL